MALSGQVVTYTGQTIPSGVEITLETEMGERAAQTPAHSDGPFDIVGLRKLRYRLIVTAGGFETGSRRSTSARELANTQSGSR